MAVAQAGLAGDNIIVPATANVAASAADARNAPPIEDAAEGG